MSDFVDVSGGYASQTTEIYLKRVTEGTTELLTPQQREQEAVPLIRGRSNTSEIN